MAGLIFDWNKCTLCQECVEVCPFHALSVSGRRIEVSAACKMCKLCVKACLSGAIALEQKAVGVDKAAWKGIMVYVEMEQDGIHPVVIELIGKARELAAKVDHPVYALMIAKDHPVIFKAADKLLEYGVDKVFLYAHEALEHFRVDVYAAAAGDCIQKLRPSVILVGATAVGRSLAPRLATRFRTGLTADCTSLEIKENTDLVQIRPAFGGNIMARIITPNTRPQFATVRYKVMPRAARVEAPTGEVVTMPVTEQMISSGIEVLETRVLEKHKGIEEEDVLIVAGKGVKMQKDLEMLKELAQLLGGQLAVTRPLVEAGWAHYTQQIGLSGRTVKPKLIITCGVSGAVQFAAGMNGAECIAAINSDPDASIFQIANYCIVDDLYQVIPGLIDRIKCAKGEVE